MGDEFDIRIVCRDRDAMVTECYPDVLVNCWNDVGKAKVFYASSPKLSLRRISEIIRNTPHDLMYLNSFFSIRFSILPLLARKLCLIPTRPCIIAPRGEFSSGAIALKSYKKRAFMRLAERLKLHDGLHWQASSSFELNDIRRELGAVARHIEVAPDLVPVCAPPQPARSRPEGPLRLVFLSRIAPKKNLDFLLRALAKVSGPCVLDIIGPKEDLRYWSECEQLIQHVPHNIVVNILESVPSEQVADIIAGYDLFAFPTRGENFGHVIFESLSAGTPVLLSDTTPWKADPHGGIQVLPLVEIHWTDAINDWVNQSLAVLLRRREAALRYVQSYKENTDDLAQNRALFNGVEPFV
jgi:glycosyltransferase involved in cell wall biosynthesis